jgi:hypothetical protein
MQLVVEYAVNGNDATSVTDPAAASWSALTIMIAEE